MSPRPGGEADKAGNRYEYLWTIDRLLDVMQGKANHICIEPIGVEGAGVEFWIEYPNHREYHQAKRSAGVGRKWTLSRLNQENVLSTFKTKVEEPNAECVFASGSTADEFQMLCERALGVTSAIELGADAEKSSFAALRSYWNNCPEPEALGALRRIRVEHWPEENLHRHVYTRIAPLVNGDEETACHILRGLIEDRVDKEKMLTAQQIWDYLSKHGIGRSEWWRDKDKLALFDAATDRYVQRLKREAIGGTLIKRQEVEEILDRLSREEGRKIVLGEGEAGAGKSDVLLQVVEAV